MRTPRPSQDLLTVGDQAPLIELVDQDSKQWSSADHAGRSIALVFHRHLH